MSFLIHRETLEEIDRAAKIAGNNECMGLLASPRESPAITNMCILPAVASAAHAEASPLALRAHMESLVSKGLIPRGIWHSHGKLPVFHSGTDHGTMERLLPAMAPWNFARPAHAIASPAVTASNSAVLPLADGRVMTFTITGSSLPEGYGYELAEWRGISTTFGTDPDAVQAAGFDGAVLALEGRGVRIELGIPEGATVQSCVQDRASYRTSTLFSLVVNVRRERFAEGLEVLDIGGESRTRVIPCDITLIGGEVQAARQEIEIPGFLRALAGR
jgi:proteasome lid subunit RPN8/RPN11